MRFVDTAVLDEVRRTRDGYLVANAKTARTGIQLYTGREVDPENELGLRDRAVVRVYRSPEEVFSRDALASMAHRPVTVDHPKEMVDATNWKELSVGVTGDEVARDGDFVRIPLTLMDQGAIDACDAGKRQLSWGYNCQIDATPGTTPEGEAFDVQQRTIRANHLATCRHARGGHELRIGDGAEPWGASPIIPAADERKPTMAELRTVMVDGLSVSVTDQGAQAIEKLTKDREDAKKALSDANTAHSKALADKDAELAKKDAEIDDLKAKQLDDAALDAKVQARADLVKTAEAIAKDVKTVGLSDADIRKAVVVAKLGDAAVKDKPQAYIDARFDILAEDATKGGDAYRDATKAGLQQQQNDAGAAHKAMTDHMTSAWQSQPVKGAA